MALLLFPISDTYGTGELMASGRITNCNCVAFRLDDIQDYYLNKAQMEIVQTFEARNTSLTIGVIGNYIGQDAALVQFLKEKIGSTSFSLDVASHGWNHEDFSLFSGQEQSELLAMSNERIVEYLGVKPSVFITPFNHMNEDTLAAMADNDLRTVSANVTGTQEPFVMNVTGPVGVVYHFPATAKTGDLNSDDTEWLGFGHEDTMREVQDSIERHGYAVVTMHPQEFSERTGTAFQNSVDRDQLAELELLIDSVHKEGYSVVTISELPNHATVQEFSANLLLASAASLAAIWIFRPFSKLFAKRGA